MRDDGDELVKGGSSNRPMLTGVGKLGEFPNCFLMPARVFAVGIDEDVGIGRDHE